MKLIDGSGPALSGDSKQGSHPCLAPQTKVEGLTLCSKCFNVIVVILIIICDIGLSCSSENSIPLLIQLRLVMINKQIF